MRLKMMVLVALLGMAAGGYAQEVQEERPDVVRLRIEGRGDYDTEMLNGDKVNEESGFRGKYLNVVLTGELAGKFSYGLRQRLNKFSKDMHFFDATDWLYLTYRPLPELALSAGKQVVAIGGYEYDRAPIDLYFCSEYWNNIPCYQWGVSASYDLTPHDKLLAQVCQSPFDTPATDLYAYNLMWYGQHGWWSTMWSLNAIGADKGRYISYVTLGNEFRMGRHWNVQIDLMNRAGRHQQWIFGDFSVMGELNYYPSSHVRLFAKGTYDHNHTHTDVDHCVLPGTEITRLGAGVEYLPLKGRWHDLVRLHANYCYSWGEQGNPNGALLDRQHLVNVGLTCRVDVLKK